MEKKSKYLKVATALLSVNLLFACSNNATTTTETNLGSDVVNAVTSEEITSLIADKVSYTDDDFYSEWENENPTYIKLNGTEAEFDSSAAVIMNDNVLTVKTGGVYVLSGNFTGQIAVDAEDKSTVKLILNGVEINNSNSSAINIVKSEKTTISLVEGTENTITDGKNYVFEDSDTDEPNAAIFSKSDLSINGTGKLVVTGHYNNGITSKDDLKITGGDIQITAVDDGLMGRDLVAVKEGNITIEAGGDGIKSSNDKDSSKGTIAFEGGTFDITAENDGIQSITSVLIADGTYSITSGGGSPETITTYDEKMGKGAWGPNSTATDTEETTTEESESDSFKGLKASTDLIIGGGTFVIDSEDDAIHSNDSLSISDGEFTIATGDDALHADSSLVTAGGKIEITKSYEGIESKSITINDGEIHVTASDDGINAGGGNDGSGMDMQSTSDESKLQINGGYVYMNAAGDGLDSNGTIEMTGGTVLVNGPTNDGNGALDYDSSFNMSGGYLIAAGSSGMVQATSEESTQAGILMTFSETQSAGTIVHLEDSEEKTIATYAPLKDYQSVFISSPELKVDTAYTLYAGGTSTGSEVDGLYSDGEYKDGTKIVDFTMAETITWLDESGVTEARVSGSGGGGRGGFGNPDGTQKQMPSDMFGDLDEETMEKVQAIMQQEREGTITREEAEAQLADLGVEMPVRGNKQ